jgi:hypothetical protein
MARVYLLSKTGPIIDLLYTIDQAVGRACPNLREDVFLVQFLVRRVLEGWNDTLPGPPLAIDGIFGKRTEEYIHHFQEGENKRVPGLMFVDGVIDPIKDRAGYVPKTDKGYTIIFLNTHYSDRYGKAWHSNIAIDPLCPASQLPSIFWH